MWTSSVSFFFALTTLSSSAASRRALVAVDMTDWYFGDEGSEYGINYQRNESLNVAKTLMANETMTFDLILDVHEHMVCEPVAESTECLLSYSARNSMTSSLLPELQHDHVGFVPKKQYSGFYGSSLDSTLRAEGIQDLYIMGYSFEWCVFFTVLDAWYRGYNVYVVVDGSGTTTEHVFKRGLDMYASYFKADRQADFFDGAHGWVRLWSFIESSAFDANTIKLV
jgi:nicotinamidase-related amidase